MKTKSNSSDFPSDSSCREKQAFQIQNYDIEDITSEYDI